MGWRAGRQEALIGKLIGEYGIKLVELNSIKARRNFGNLDAEKIQKLVELFAKQTIEKNIPNLITFLDLHNFPYYMTVFKGDTKWEEASEEIKSGFEGLRELRRMEDNGYFFNNFEEYVKIQLEKIFAKSPKGIESIFSNFQESTTEKVMGTLVQSPELSCVAGTKFSEERFERYGDKLAETVAQSAQRSYLAGVKWDIERFERHSDKLVEGVIQSADHSRAAGENWPRKLFEKYGDKIIAKITTSAEFSYRAGHFWAKRRFDTYADELVETVSQDPVWSFQAGVIWKDERFDTYADELLEATSQDLRMVLGLKGSWRKERFDKYQERIIELVNQYHSGEKDEREGILQTWEAYDLVSNSISQLSGGEMEQAIESLGDNFGKALKKGTVKEWADYIIKHFNDGAIGGGNYRMLEVVG